MSTYNIFLWRTIIENYPLVIIKYSHYRYLFYCMMLVVTSDTLRLSRKLFYDLNGIKDIEKISR